MTLAKPGWSRLVAMVLVMLSLRSPALANKRVALVIGNSDYQAPGMPHLFNTKRDADDIGKKLDSLGFAVTVRYDRCKKDLLQDIEAFLNQAKGADLALFYYSGHGVRLKETGQNFLIPVDFGQGPDRSQLSQGVELETLVQRAQIAAKASVILLDACRTDPLGGPKGSSPLEQMTRGLYLSQTFDGDVLILYAAAAGKPALDGPRGDNSPFAKALVEHLGDDQPLSQIAMSVSRRVRALTSDLQKPEIQGQLTDALCLSGDCRPPPPGPARPNRAIYRKWWLWSLVGGAAASLAVGLGIGLTRPPAAEDITWR